MRQERDMGDRQDRSDRDFGRDRDGERERGAQRSGVEERFSRFNGQGLPIRVGNDTASRFQWTYLLRDSGNSTGDGVERGFPDCRDDYHVKRYDGFSRYDSGSDEYRGRSWDVTGRSIEHPGYHRRITNVVTRIPDESTEFPGYTRNVTSLSAEKPGCHGRIRNAVTGLPDEGTEYRVRTRNVSGLSAEDPEYHGLVRNIVTDLPNVGTEYHSRYRYGTGPQIENAEYNGHSRNMTGLRSEGSDFNGNSRKMTTGLPVEDAGYSRGTRTVMTSQLVEDGGRSLVRDYQRSNDREILMKTYEEDNCLRFRIEDSSRSLTPHSPSGDQHATLRGIPFSNLEGPRQGLFHHHADEHGIGGNIPSSSCYSPRKKVYSNSSTNSCPMSIKGSIYPRAEHNSSMGRHVEYTHSASQRSEMVHRSALSEAAYENHENVQDYRDHRDTHGINILDPALTRHDCLDNSYNCALDNDGLHSSDHTLQEAQRQRLEYGTEACYKFTPCKEDCPYEIDEHGIAHEDQGLNHPVSEEGTLSLDEDAQHMMRSRDMDLHGQPKRMPKRKRGFVGKMSWPKRRTSTLGGIGALSYGTTEPENELDYSNRSSSHHAHLKETAKKSKTESRLPFGGLSKELQSRLSKPFLSSSNDVKTRLKHSRFIPRLYGPQAARQLRENVYSCVNTSVNTNHIDSQPYGKGKCKTTKKWLKPALYMDVCLSDLQVSHPGLDIELQQKLGTKNFVCTIEAPPQDADPDHSILKVKPLEKDPDENSQELKRLVDYWFLKCMLYLNINPGRLKKLKEPGKNGTLKCIICSSSKEFIQTKDVATHAFTSPKVGFRAAHLGFHRALCVLMGWDLAVASNGRWVCKSLPDVEALALKEDIIVWPPVVIIHYGSTRDFYNKEQVKISIKQLENILRAMGLSEGTATVCHGKPGNPNVMLVKFNGTLSNLQEAERLHSVFSEKKHGRAQLQEIDVGVGCNEGVPHKSKNKIELQEIDAGVQCNESVALKSQGKIEFQDIAAGVCNGGGAQKSADKKEIQEIDARVGCNEEVSQKSVNQIEDALYGYLGIVEDFNKLNYDMRRHCVAKSKKEILACVDTTT